MKARRLLLGMLAGYGAGALVTVLAWGLVMLGKEVAADLVFSPRLIAFAEEYGGALIAPSFLLVPFAVGMAAAFVWKPLELRIGAMALQSLYLVLLGLGLAWIVLHEGVICLLIVAPLLYAGVLAGALTGRVLFRATTEKLNLFIAPLALLVVSTEPVLRTSHQGVVTDEVRINATPERVWPHVLAFPEIPDPPAYWLFHLGLPYPVKTTNAGNFVGAARACEFSGGAVFEEEVAEIAPGRMLTFDIVKSPPHPELIGHLDARRGQFELRDNGDGSTTLIGRTWYSLHVRPAFYFDSWTHDIFRAVHLRVMNHIKRLAETEA